MNKEKEKYKKQAAKQFLKIMPNGMCQASRIRWPGNKGELKKIKRGRIFSCPCGEKAAGATESRGRRLGTFHSLSGLISRPLGRLRLLLLALLLLLLLLALHLLHVPLLGGRLKLT